MSIITRKIEVYIAEADKAQQKAYKDTVYAWAKYVYQAANIAMGARFNLLQVCQTMDLVDPSVRTNVSSILKDEKGISKRNIAYKIITAVLKDKSVPSNITGALAQILTKKFDDVEYKIRKGEVSVPSFKYGMPIPFMSRCLDKKIRKTDDERYYFTLMGIPFACRLGRDRSNNAAVLDAVIEGKYKLSTSSIKVDGKDMYLLLCVNVPDEKKDLDPKKVVGLDLGINVPIYAAVNDSLERCPIGSRELFLNQKTQFCSRRKALQRSVKDAKGGKGRSHKLRALDDLREAERNWTKTMNHTYSHRAVEFALKQGAGVIQMEDLSGFGKLRNGKADETKEFLLRNWCFFELQTMIEYKAKHYGIKIRFVEPAYTSQRCSECGEIGVRDDKDKTKFHCQNPKCSFYRQPFIHADWNGARNISRSTDFSKKNDKSTD